MRKSQEVQLSWSYKGSDYLVTCSVFPGRKGGKFGPHWSDPPLPDDDPDMEVIDVTVDGEPSLPITSETFIAAQEDDCLFQSALDALSASYEDDRY